MSDSLNLEFDDLLSAWSANEAINKELLGLCSDEDLDLKPGKGKTIRSNYVHLVAFRRYHAEDKLRSEAALIPKLDWKTATREEILAALEISQQVLVNILRKLAAKPGKWTAPMFFAYTIAHEAHHRSQVEIALRLNGREPDDALLYRLWEWTKKDSIESKSHDAEEAS